MIVRVTAEDIKHGLRQTAWACPVVLALKRAFDVEEATCGLTTATVGRFRSTPIPLEVGNRIMQYDKGWGMEPFEFEFTPENY
jgi:hypothetical protein